MLRKHGRKPWHQSSIYCLIMPSFGLASMRITCHPLRFKANSLVSWLFPFDHGPPFLPRFFCSRQLTADSQELTEIVDFLKAPERFVKVFLLEWCWSSFASKIWFDNTSMKSNVAPGPTMKHMTCLKDFESRSLLTHRPCDEPKCTWWNVKQVPTLSKMTMSTVYKCVLKSIDWNINIYEIQMQPQSLRYMFNCSVNVCCAP